MKTPSMGTKKKPKYCDAAEYQPAVTLSTLKRCSASSVAFCEKTIAVEVWKMVKQMIPQYAHGSWVILRSSNLRFLSVNFSPVAGSVQSP